MTSLLLWKRPSNMGIFGKDREELPKIATRADAFAYMLTVRMDSGDDAMEAARKAKFRPSERTLQGGTITYVFKLQ